MLIVLGTLRFCRRPAAIAAIIPQDREDCADSVRSLSPQHAALGQGAVRRTKSSTPSWSSSNGSVTATRRVDLPEGHQVHIWAVCTTVREPPAIAPEPRGLGDRRADRRGGDPDRDRATAIAAASDGWRVGVRCLRQP